MNFNFDELKVQGVKFNYYFVCKRKLWLFSNGISMEDGNERVQLGKLIHENSYRSKNKEILIDNMIKLDILEKDTVREVKITSKMMETDKLQLQYYLYYLKKLGIKKVGTLNYIKEKRVEKVFLDKETEIFIEETLETINVILRQSYPPKIEKYNYCKKCAYYEFCYIKEVE